MLDRRTFIVAAIAVGSGCAAGSALEDSSALDLARLQERLGPGGRLGVAAFDAESGRWFGHDQHSLYAMASTFKWALAAAILMEVEAGRLSLEQEIGFGASDLVPYAPVIEANLATGRLSIERLCAAIVEVSDNAAANLLLDRIGGPAGLTRFFRRCGDPVSRLDRTEPELNSNLLGDPRDTTSPAAMVGLMRSLLLGGMIGPASRALLFGWMEGASTGRQRLRAGFPAGWRSGDKTGSGANGAANDVAMTIPPGRAPILVACYQSNGNAEQAVRDGVHSEVARRVMAAFA